MLRLRLVQTMQRAEVAELADARDSKSRGPCGHEGSTPSFGTNRINNLQKLTFSRYPEKGVTLPVTLPIVGLHSIQAPIIFRNGADKIGGERLAQILSEG